MTTFDELIGAEPEGAERDRLRRVHELLLEAGPPAELTPELAAGPTLNMTLGRVRRPTRSRRRIFLPAIAAALLVAAIIGISVAGNGKGLSAIALTGTAYAPQATGTLEVLPPEAGKQPMRIHVEGLALGRYAVYLVRAGRPWAECGSFTVTRSAASTVASLNSPYRLKTHDTWVVTQLDRSGGHGVTVLHPATA
jgi:hypothetical protein